ncbi:MAG TPA: radical SAM protein [Anaerolineae bacterium]|nr:radical SAM protein [Anaerolineae bacterium]
MSGRVLIIDLNNFGHYPTLSVGYLTAILRQEGYEVELLSPLAQGLAGVTREPEVKPWSGIDHYVRYYTATSSSAWLRRLYQRIVDYMRSPLSRNMDEMGESVAGALRQGKYDAVLVSTYLIYRPLCKLIGEACQAQNIPLLIGGAYFSQPEVVDNWVHMSGVTGLVSGEVEPQIPAIMDCLISGGDLTQFTGLWTSKGGAFAPPLVDLDQVPFPDFTDFPWEQYKNRIVPVLTGRGCGWGVCTFCSDVVSTAGRSFRSRSVDNVWAEIEQQAERHQADLFVFTDLKLNSNPEMWTGLIERFQKHMPGSRWISSVHVGRREAETLSAEQLRAAHEAGLVRITTGLESGSQNILNSMRKGTDLGLTSRFLKAADGAGISVRTTMIMGYPGETAEDLAETIDFVAEHAQYIERIALNRFQLMTGTPIHRDLSQNSNKYEDIYSVEANHALAQLGHQSSQHAQRDYRGEVWRLIQLVQKINRRPLKPVAQPFLGVM